MKKYIAIAFVSVILLFGIFIFQNLKFNDNRLHIIFCDVGQGDAILIRTPSNQDVLVDSGPNNLVVDCLSKHLPFWDKTIELAILTHPHADHMNGFLDVLKNYKVLSFATENLKNNSLGFKVLMESLKAQNIKIRYVYLGDRFRFSDGVTINIVGPSKEFLANTSPDGVIGERNEFANVESLIKYGKFSVLLTGDSQSSELDEILKQVQNDKQVSVLQVPHHGSKTGLTDQILNVLNPNLAVISVGKNNKYGHPNPFTLDLLKNKNIKTLRTDENGDIEIISDGKSWKVN